MRAGRLILVVATLATILVLPILIRDISHGLQLPNAYAAVSVKDPAGRTYANGNNDGGDNDNHTRGNGGSNNNNNNASDNNSNDNVECFPNLNDNHVVPCDFNNNGNANNNNGNNNHNDNGFAPPPPPPASSGYVPQSSRCFSAQESGDVVVNLAGGSITVRVVSAAPLPQSASIGLSTVDPATVPPAANGATFVDTLVWQMQANSPCDGQSVGQLPGAVNLGVLYNVSANKSKLQIVMLNNGAWVEVPTTPDPDPNNPYISATVQQTGTYAVIQKP